MQNNPSERAKMKYSMRLALVLILVVATTSCNGNRTDITGSITRDGKPVVIEGEEGHILVLFLPEKWKSNSQVFRAEVDRTSGTFRISEIRTGRYLVAIQQFDARHNDALGSKYNPGISPLRADVTENGQVIDFDLPK